MLPAPVIEESPRDMAESGFTPILRALLQSAPGILAVIFVDSDGECIDYCSTLPPFDAKVIAAHMLVVTMVVQEEGRARGGALWSMLVSGSERDVLVRRVGDEYALVVVTRSGSFGSVTDESVEVAVRALRHESGVGTPSWEPRGDRVRVEVRGSTRGWSYAPKAFWHRGDHVQIDDVLGRWVDADGSVCFRVRTDRGVELTLVHRPEEDRWERL